MIVMTPDQRDALDAAAIALAARGIHAPARCTTDEMQTYFYRKGSLASFTLRKWRGMGVRRLWNPRRKTMIGIALGVLRGDGS
jgi:hypothetical protein